MTNKAKAELLVCLAQEIWDLAATTPGCTPDLCFLLVLSRPNDPLQGLVSPGGPPNMQLGGSRTGQACLKGLLASLGWRKSERDAHSLE